MIIATAIAFFISAPQQFQVVATAISPRAVRASASAMMSRIEKSRP
jgi:hypothetical protein